MNTAKLRSKRAILTTSTVAALAAAAGVGVWATGANADVRGDERDRVADAAVKAVGGGTVTDVETDDERGGGYEVEVSRPDGSEVDVTLDRDLTVIAQEAETPDDAPATRVPTAAERATVEKAVLAAFAGGTVTDVEISADRGVAYEAEVRAADATEWDVQLDAKYTILTRTADR
jgi:uncharacterized membrane protein YkoI